MTELIGKLEQWLPRKKRDIFGKNSLINSSIPYYTLAFLITIGLLLSSKTGAVTSTPFLFISIVYSFIPILDELYSLDERNPTEEERKQLEKNDPYFRMTLYAALILFYALSYRYLCAFSVREVTWHNVIKIIAGLFTASNLFSVQFAVAHQLMHKNGRFYRWLATFHMIILYYPHYITHHLTRHHRDVATPMDTATAQKGDNVYRFVLSSVINSWRVVYQDEKERGKCILTNIAILSLFSSITFASLVYIFFGLQAIVMHSIVAFGAIFYLQAINYIEHYGLSRKPLPGGGYEKVTILHSWNAPHRFSNYLLFKLQRHSDHHQNSSKPFQTLVSLEQSPFLPHGYNLMILMSFFPKTWYRIMDPLVDAYSKLDVEKGERVPAQIMAVAVTETRKFLIEVALSAFLLFVLSVTRVI